MPNLEEKEHLLIHFSTYRDSAWCMEAESEKKKPNLRSSSYEKKITCGIMSVQFLRYVLWVVESGEAC